MLIHHSQHYKVVVTTPTLYFPT